MIYELRQKEKASILFNGWQETIIWSCLQNVMGQVYADSTESPASAMALLGDFCFLAGKPMEELVLYKPENNNLESSSKLGKNNKLESNRQDFVIMVPQNEIWAGMIEDCYKEKAKKVVRYAFKKNPDAFDQKALQKAIQTLPEEYTLKMMDRELFYRCREIAWCRDWVSQYRDYEMYQQYGLGAVILKEGEPIFGASSYSGYRGGIEIEIDTREDCRRQGLAYVCGAKLILECLKRGWNPSWDAQNLWSATLAQKLGYQFDCEYTAYEVSR